MSLILSSTEPRARDSPPIIRCKISKHQTSSSPCCFHTFLRNCNVPMCVRTFTLGRFYYEISICIFGNTIYDSGHIYTYTPIRCTAVKKNTLYYYNMYIQNNCTRNMQKLEIVSRRQIFIDSIVNVHGGTNHTLERHSNRIILLLLIL